MGRFRVALGVRGVILVGLGSWFGLVRHNEPGATGVGLLVGLLLILADFHGDPFRRLRAYALTTLIGAALVAGGVLISALPPLTMGVIVAVLGSALALIRSGGGVFAAAGTALVADLLVGVGAGLHGSSLAPMTIAAVMGGVGATVLAFTISPAPWVSPVRTASADLLGHCAEVVVGTRSPATLQGSSRALLTVYIDRPERPATPLPSALASVSLLADLTFLADRLAAGGVPPNAAASAESLEAARLGLLQPRSQQFRDRLRVALTQQVNEPRTDQDFQAVAISQGAREIAERTLALMPANQQLRTPRRADVVSQLRTRLSPASTVLWNALASGMLFGALAVLAATLRIDHPQWVLLVAVSTFYPYARRAATKAAAIIAGTLIALVLLTGLVWLLESTSPWWWLVLLLATGISMSAPHTTAGTILGQCTFTLLSLTMLGLASHGIGGHAIQERAIDIALGAGIAVVTVLVVAPRGLRRRLRTSIAELLDTAAQAIGDAPADAVRGQDSGSLGILARSQFLRCVDIVDVMHGGAAVQHDHLVDWLDAARVAGQACVTSAMCAAAAGDSTPAPAYWAEAQARYQQQATALRSGDDLAKPAATAPQRPADEPWSGAATWLLHNADRQADLLESLRSEPAEHRRTPTRT